MKNTLLKIQIFLKIKLIKFNFLIILILLTVYNFISSGTIMCAPSEELGIIPSPTSVAGFQDTLEISEINVEQIYLDTLNNIDVDLNSQPRRRFSVAQSLYESYHFLGQIVEALREFFSWGNDTNIETGGGRTNEIEDIADYWANQQNSSDNSSDNPSSNPSDNFSSNPSDNPSSNNNN